MLQHALLVSASLATLGCVSAGGLGFIAGLKDAGAQRGSVGGMLKAMFVVGGSFAAVMWGWALFAIHVAN